ncbi:MAG: acyltransferase [Anaeromyxobacter sp.]
MGPRDPPRLQALAGLRFVAAAGILLFHFGGPLTAGAPAWVERLREGGHAWVGLFYLLSGFVLAQAHPAPMTAPERRAFLVARLARLYPAYLLAFLLSAPATLARWDGLGAPGALRAAVVAGAALLLVQAWLPIARLWNPPGWSTSVVASFYVAFPALVARLSRLRRRGLALALGAAWGASLALPLLYLWLQPEGPGAELLAREPRWLEALKFHPLARAGEFGAGVVLGLLQQRGQLRRVGSGAAVVALLAAAGILAGGAAPYLLLHNGLLVPLYAVTVVGLAQGGRLARALGSRPLAALGDASFALYALQFPLWHWARVLADAPPDPVGPGFVLAFAAAAAAVSLAVSRLLERPARRWLRAALTPARAGLRAPPARSGGTGRALPPAPP